MASIVNGELSGGNEPSLWPEGFREDKVACIAVEGVGRYPEGSTRGHDPGTSPIEVSMSGVSNN